MDWREIRKEQEKTNIEFKDNGKGKIKMKE